MADQVLMFMTHYNLFTASQFGFRKKLSTTDAVTFFNKFISKGFNDKSFVHATLCDLSRAFECLNHKILLDKLKHYKFCDASIMLIKNYLQKRAQIVKVGGKLSEPRLVNVGIPTGSILGPLIFLIYINDLPSNLPSYTKASVFADDTTFFVVEKNQDELKNKSEIALAQAQVWFRSNRLHLNEAKTQKIILGLGNVTWRDNPSSVQLLGFSIDPHLKWQAHIEKISNKLSSRIFLLYKLQYQVSTSTLKNIYYGLFHSLLNYGVLLWGHSCHTSQLFIIQKKAVRMVGRVKPLEHARPQFIKLGILTLPSLFILQCLLHVRKNINDYTNFEDVHTYNTRNKKKLVPICHRVNAARNGVNYYGISFFNKLPQSIRDLPYPLFKTSVEDVLRREAFYSVSEFLTGNFKF